MSDLDRLRDIAQIVRPPAFEELLQTRRRRTRRARLAAASTLAVAATALVAALTSIGGIVSTDPQPVAPSPSPSPTTARKIVYSDGYPSHTIHFGDRVVESGNGYVNMDVTDDGFVYATGDGRVWFSDGGRPEQIGSRTMANTRTTLGPGIALVALLSLAGCADDSTANSSIHSVGSGSSAGSLSPGAASSGTTSTSGPADYTAVIDVNSERAVLSAGRYALAPIGPSAGPLAVVDVPEGFLNDGPFLFPVGEDAAGEHAAVSRAIGYWSVTGVYKDPCRKNADAADPGPSAMDLALALTAQRGTETTDPTPVTLDGYDGLYMELTAPTRLDYGTCRFKTFDYWVSDPVGGAYTDQPGLVTQLWIIDVQTDRVIIAVTARSRVPKADIQEVTDIAESASFVVH